MRGWVWVAVTVGACARSPDVLVPAAAPRVAEPPAYAATFASYLDALEAHRRWSGSVAITRNGVVEVQDSAGSLDGTGAAPIGPDTRLWIGSITKTFTAVVVMQLIEQGKLTLDSPLSTWFPTIPGADRVTIDHLLAHRSGLRSVTSDDDYLAWLDHPVTHEEIVARIASYEPVFEPGARAEYSNSGYILLGYIIEAVEGRPYGDVVRERILEPVGMPRTRYAEPIDVTRDEARSFEWDGRGWAPSTETHPTVPGAAGALVSTPAELCAFAEALFEGRLVSAASLAAMQELREQVGRGLFRFPFHDRHAWGHTGAIDGFSSQLAWFPEDRLCAALIGSAADTPTNDVAIAALTLAFGLPFEMPPVADVAVAEADLQRWVGRYTSSDLPLEVEVRLDGGVLFAQATGQAAFPLRPESPTEFTFERAGIRFVFDVGADGQVGFRLVQGDEYRYVRQP
jgi:D-alanyl-D-alanine carboxypeptidase